MSGVVITGVGLVCAVGDKPAEVHQALCERRTGIGASTLFPEQAGARGVGEVRDFVARNYLGPKNLRPLDRTGQLAAVAAELALADGGWTPDPRDGREVGLVLGTTFCSARTIGEFDRRAMREGVEYASPLDFANTVINAAAGQVAIWHRLRGVNSTISTGAASGLHAIGYAAQLIRAGRATALIAGGAEELCFESHLGFLRAAIPDRGHLHGRREKLHDGNPGTGCRQEGNPARLCHADARGDILNKDQLFHRDKIWSVFFTQESKVAVELQQALCRWGVRRRRNAAIVQGRILPAPNLNHAIPRPSDPRVNAKNTFGVLTHNF
jgi:hypothetical protein